MLRGRAKRCKPLKDERSKRTHRGCGVFPYSVPTLVTAMEAAFCAADCAAALVDFFAPCIRHTGRERGREGGAEGGTGSCDALNPTTRCGTAGGRAEASAAHTHRGGTAARAVPFQRPLTRTGAAQARSPLAFAALTLNAPPVPAEALEMTFPAMSDTLTKVLFHVDTTVTNAEGWGVARRLAAAKREEVAMSAGFWGNLPLLPQNVIPQSKLKNPSPCRRLLLSTTFT